jgi:hypothetical protein
MRFKTSFGMCFVMRFAAIMPLPVPPLGKPFPVGLALLPVRLAFFPGPERLGRQHPVIETPVAALYEPAHDQLAVPAESLWRHVGEGGQHGGVVRQAGGRHLMPGPRPQRDRAAERIRRVPGQGPQLRRQQALGVEHEPGQVAQIDLRRHQRGGIGGHALIAPRTKAAAACGTIALP